MDRKLQPSLSAVHITHTNEYWMGIIGLFALVGCGQSLLYDATRDKLGQVAVKAASDVKLNDTVIAVNKRFDGLLALELDAVRVRAAHIRELEIRELAFKKSDTWLARIDRRTSKIAGGNANAVTLSNNRSEIKAARNSFTEDQDSFRDTFLLAAPSCEDVTKSKGLPESIQTKISEKQRLEDRQVIDHLLSSCMKLNEAEKTRQTFIPGDGSELDRATRQLKDDLNEKENNDAARKEAQAKLNQAIAAYLSESNRLATPGDQSTYTSRVMTAAQKLRQGVEGLEKAQNAFGSEVVAKERLNRIEELLSALAMGDTDTSKWNDDLRKAMAIAGSLPTLADEASATLSEAERPRLIPLTIAREHQRLIVEEAAKVDKIISRRVVVAENIVKAYENEMTTLLDIKEKITKEQEWHSKSLIQLNKDLANAPDQKRLLYELLGIYFDEIPRLQSEQRALEYMRLATFYEETQERSKSAALMWQNSLDGIATTLANYHSTGIKPEDLARFIQAFGITAIGVGANR